MLITGLWMLDKMKLPKWLQPIVVSIFGFVQDLSLDPLSLKQIYTVGGVTSARWNWILSENAVEIFDVPVYNFPGWSIIMLYSSTVLLIGRYLYKKSGYKKIIGYAYPFVGMLIALLTMMSPVSRFLLWLEPFGQVQTNAEWVMFVAWLVIPIALLVFVWRGRMRGALTLKNELPIFLVPVALHLTDIIFTIYGGFWTILPLVLGVSVVHFLFLGLMLYLGNKQPADESEFSLTF